MTALVYVGDEVSAAGFRLAGVRCTVPQSGTETAALAAALSDASLVLVSAAVAACVDEGEMRAALMALAPLTLVVPDLQGTVALPDPVARLKRQLGMEPSA